ncbi:MULTISPECIES: ComEA family DNA-binding protein [Actinosynnema]|uniref:helix-hairpin-helix domain-containing protein n=1 Tax=Actinosynnema TaxID=40566 RepID=UPI0020A409A8|nr:ComEA family DNA-binding protein [Actinosynnema pretiosum]MCP2092979.1 competence protein ComEA [Actinosynnema pretiosum]
MFDNHVKDKDSSDRLRTLMADPPGKHRSEDAPTVVFATSEGGVDPPGLLLRLRQLLPSAAHHRRRVAVLGVAGAGAALAAVLAAGGREAVVEQVPVLPVAEATSSSAAPPVLVVDVAGEVHAPGLVTVEDGARVADVLSRAGGVKPGASLTGLNLARKVTDGEQIAVGVPPAVGGGTGPPAPVNINTATVEQLDALPGVGPVTAQRIVDHRARRGRFASVQQLGEVEGIGGSKLAKLTDLIRV